MTGIDIRAMGYDSSDAQRLIAQVQQEYVVRYGGPDGSAVDPAQFTATAGSFLVIYRDDEPVAMGGWRRLDTSVPALSWLGAAADSTPGSGASSAARSAPGSAAKSAAELKRMYVVPAARGQGLARTLLQRLEAGAAAAGLDWVLLETGLKQPEAVQLYRSCGYRDVPPFGHYADAPLSLHLGKRLAGAARVASS